MGSQLAENESMPGDAPDLTVILCVHNGAATMRNQLDALAGQQWDGRWEVLIVDHASVDATPAIAAEYVDVDGRFRPVRADGTPGLSHARNVGVANTAATAVAFCDDDDLVEDGWVAAMGEALRSHPVVACRFEWDHDPEGRSAVGGSFQRNGLETVFGYQVAAGV